jgi:hypothetical protein
MKEAGQCLWVLQGATSFWRAGCGNAFLYEGSTRLMVAVQTAVLW